MQGVRTRKITEPTDWAMVDCGEPVVNLLMAVYHDIIKDAYRELRHQKQESESCLFAAISDDLSWMMGLSLTSGSNADALIKYMLGVESGRDDE